jgi:hypothetical protein
MNRLYYDAPKLRTAQPEAVQGSQQQPVAEFLTKVATLVPSEIVAAYLTMLGLASTITDDKIRNYSCWAILLMCTFLTPLYLNKVATLGKPKLNHIIISTVAFLVWAYVTSGQQLTATITSDPNMYSSALASIILIGFSLISGLVPLNK